jgi:hypothetical protein
MRFPKKLAVLTGLASLVLGGPLLQASSAQASQSITKYCTADGVPGYFRAFSSSTDKNAGTWRTTGPYCDQYYVNTHYIVTTTGADYWMGYAHGTEKITQSPGYYVDQAKHKTDTSSEFTTK